MSGPDPFAGFNPMAIQPSTGGGNQLPLSGAEGYPVIITGCEVKNLKNAANGSKVEFTVAIQAPSPHAGLSGKFAFNIGHIDPQTSRIALEQVTALTRVLGFREVMSNSQQLYNKPFKIVVDYQKGQDPSIAGAKGYTEMKYCLDINGLKADDPNAGMTGPTTAAPGSTAPVAATPAAPAVAPVAAPVVAPVAAPAETAASFPAPAAAPAIQPVAAPQIATAPMSIPSTGGTVAPADAAAKPPWMNS